MLKFVISAAALAIGAILGIIFAVKAKNIPAVPSKNSSINTIGIIFNIAMIPVYAMATPMMLFLSMVSEAYQQGFWGVMGWIIAGIIWIAPFFFGSGLGLSALLRKKGKPIASLIVQFAGIMAIIVAFILYAVFVGSLLAPLN